MPTETIEINATGLLLHRADGSQNLLLHHELQAVEILNAEEVYFLLIGPNSSVVVPHRAVGADELLKHLQKLPGFDNEAVITAMTTEGKFECWKKPV